jgi:hypothetical protein
MTPTLTQFESRALWLAEQIVLAEARRESRPRRRRSPWRIVRRVLPANAALA